MAEWLRGQLTDAERAFAASVTGWRETSQPTLIAWGYYELVLIRRGQGRLDAAALTCEQALDSLVTSVRPAAVGRGTELRGPGRDRLPAGRTRPRAAVLLAQDRPDRALALLNRLHAAAAAQDRTGSLIEIGALRALALAASGEEAGAVAALAQALTLACPQGYVRIFADEGPPMAALLGRLIAAQRAGQAAAEVPLGCLARLQRAFDPGHAMPVCGRLPAGAVPGLVEPLTSRELEVLGMLAVGRSNQAVAGELVVTINTVKKHVSHILDKLGTANRTEAVSRARELGLIP